MYKAIEQVEAEVWVVDNASSDGSVEYLQSKFPHVYFIKNLKNVGFAKANNQALLHCTGDYILFLNPDTILSENCLTQSILFIVQNSLAGALGIRMIDGSGAFLPESKRSFPSPVTAFYKLAGLSRLFPKSKIFSKYSLAYLDEYKNHEVDVLSGAFMLVKRELVVSLKGFDESFFMYGEDIDLSYRLQKAGYKNYYFSGSSIIHFKGESTRKGSLNYVKMFYLAMSIFVKKHYTGNSANIFSFFIQTAIWLRACLSAMLRFGLKIGLPLVDAVNIFIAFKITISLWIIVMRHSRHFNEHIVDVALPCFTIIFLTAAALAGIYDNKYKPLKAFYAALTSIIVMLAVYSLLPEQYRFSRGVILIGGAIALLFITVFRWLLLKLKIVHYEDESKKEYQTIVVGTNEEYAGVKKLFTVAGLQERIMGQISADGTKENNLGTVSDLENIAESINIGEIIFCQGFLSYSLIIGIIQNLPKNISLRFHAKGTESIVGSDSKDTSGESVSAQENFQIAQPYQKRMKRIADISVSLFLFVTFPVHLLLIGYKSLSNALIVLIGRKTWIGYSRNYANLPPLRNGVLSILPSVKFLPENEKKLFQIEYWYARNYDWKQDLKIIVKNYRRLAQTV